MHNTIKTIVIINWKSYAFNSIEKFSLLNEAYVEQGLNSGL